MFTGTLDALRAAEAGYNVMVQDCRGRFASAGVWNCFTDEARDGYDTIEWAARQGWANGNVGTYGASYMGATQWLAATHCAAEPEGDGAVDHCQRLSRRMDLPGRRVLIILQRELDDGRARSRATAARARRQSRA